MSTHARAWRGCRHIILFLALPGLPLASTGLAQEQHEFPSRGILPKEETGAIRFLEQHPAYDGRGVVVAIFDTGVDPGAAGLQQTPDGRPKIIDLIDGSGSGDVDTSTVRTATEGQLHGLTGRRLRLGSDWENPSGEYHLGLKAGYELFPGPLVDRLKQSRKEQWDQTQRELEADLLRQLGAWDALHATPAPEEIRERKDLQTRLEQLRLLQEAYEDPGPVFDCVVFYDGADWRAVVDTDSDGDLAEEVLLSNFSRARQHATFGEETLLNFAVNIYDEGRLLSIVADSGMHGTHVAGIVSAFFPDEPELNGVAPGAQIVSVKIGDSRLDGMETATGFVRGLAAVREHGCDVINLSYGEPTTLPNAGRLIRLLSEVVNEDGVIFVSSAGNDGPAMSTVGAPGGTTTALIGVGAYVSSAMMESGYSMRQGLPETQYTWSSRGPTIDGDLGVNISAPGGAISPVPNWTLQRHQMANGTSMASPNAAGAVALLLSGLKAEGVRYSPASIRRALENSTRTIAGVEIFAQGRGLIQVEPAFELCKVLASESRVQPRLEVLLPREDTPRGVYLREPEETLRPSDVMVRVHPVFPKSAENRLKAEFERRYRLQATADWIQAPDYLLLAHAGRTFDIRIDPTQLDPGVHYAELLGFETGFDTGPAFRLPVTVIRPLRPVHSGHSAWTEQFSFTPGHLERRFLAVPAGATWAELTVEAGDLDSPRRLVVHTMQSLARQPYTTTETKRYVTLDRQDKDLLRFPVVGGRTLELCLGQNWSSLGEGVFDFRLSFQGVVPDSENLFLDANAGVVPVGVMAALGEARLAPQAQLRFWRRSIPPSQAEIRPLNVARDSLTEGRQTHELILTYPIHQEQPGTVIPRTPALNGRLYDGEFESQLWMMFDSGKRLIAVDDAWDPGRVRLESGDHVLRFHLRHDQAAWLDKLKDLPLVLDQELASSLDVPCYADPDQALINGAKFAARSLAPGRRARFYLAPPPRADFIKAAQPGDLLVGVIRYETDFSPCEYPLLCSVPQAVPGKTEPETGKTDDELSLGERLAQERREFEVSQLDRLMGDDHGDDFDALAAVLEAKYPDHLPIAIKRLHRIDNDRRTERLRSVVVAAAAVLSRIDASELAAQLGTRPVKDHPHEQRVRREMEQQRDALVDALYRKGRALAWMELPTDEATDPADADEIRAVEDPFEPDRIEELFEATYRDLCRWVDPASDDYVLLEIRREWRHGRLGEALRLLQGKLKTSPTDAMLHRKRLRLFEELGWTPWVGRERVWQLIRFPSCYPPF